MCKFVKPTIPADATADDRRGIMFDALCSLDLSDKIEKRNNLTYLSWANAWQEFKSANPSATYRIVKNPATGLPYVSDPSLGIIVFTEVTVDNVTHEMWLPVMNSANKAMKEIPYSYQAWDNDKRTYVEKTVQAATMFDVNKTIMRCLVKNLAMFGLGLYIYTGDDLPQTDEQTNPTASATATPPQPVDKFASIKNAINSMPDINALTNLYWEHEAEINGNLEIKALFTQRKQQLQLLNKN